MRSNLWNNLGSLTVDTDDAKHSVLIDKDNTVVGILVSCEKMIMTVSLDLNTYKVFQILFFYSLQTYCTVSIIFPLVQ